MEAPQFRPQIIIQNGGVKLAAKMMCIVSELS